MRDGCTQIGLSVILVCFALCPRPLEAAAPAPAPQTDQAPARLSALERIVHRFGFEEFDAAPNSLPVYFYRFIAPSQGFPPFGSMRLSNATAVDGQNSFEFELGGGSMSARTSTNTIPILPLADYVVSAKVRTQGLKNARARLVAWLHDKTGQPILRSRSQSRLIETAGEWESLSAEIPGDYTDAADLVIELQVLQPEQFNGLGGAGDVGAIDPDRPRLEDITGRAWFDEVIVTHLPRIKLTMAQSSNVVIAPQLPELSVLVSELTTEALSARMRAFNLDGRCIFDSTFPAPRGRQASTIRLPLSTCGWYRAVLDVSSKAGLAQRQWLDFVIVPAQVQHESTDVSRFGIVLADMTPEAMKAVPELVTLSGSGHVIAPVWRHDSGSDDDHDHRAALRQMIDQLLLRHVGLVFSLDVVPDQLARAAGVDASHVLDLAAKDSRLWRPYLDDLLVNFGLEISRWQIGGAGSAEAFWTSDLRSIVQTVTKSFADFVPQPVIYTSWSIEQAAAAEDQLPAYSVNVPFHVQPESLAEYAGAWMINGSQISTTLQLLPDGDFTPHQQVVDLTLRTLYGWRAGLPLINIAAPWHAQPGSGGDGRLMPDPVFAAWRGLDQQLTGRRFVGELPLTAGLHCWILGGNSAADAAVVAWCDGSGPPHTSTTTNLQSQLAGGPVEVIDAFGNTSTINPIDGVHTVPLTDTPVFIKDVNLGLVEFRSDVHIEPRFVPAISKVHEHQIVLRNPWNVAVSGTIRLTEDGEWTLSPLVQDFAIGPRSEVRLPLSIIPQRSILAGQKQIPTEITLQADQPYTMKLLTELEVGLKDIELAASWRISYNPLTEQEDLIITQAVTNKGDRPVNLDVNLLATGLGQTRRTIGGLGPGETAVRSFRVANGGVLLAGQQVRIGVSERDGATRLNRMLSITPRQGPLQASVENHSP